MSFVLPAKLGGVLTDREAVADALYRVVLSFDHADEELLLSAVTEDISAELGSTISAKGIPEFKAVVFDRVARLDTTHLPTNVRVHMESATTAKATCSAITQHARPGRGFEPGPHRFLGGGTYLCELVKDGDLWKVRNWKANILWVDGDPAVVDGNYAH